MVQLVNLGTQQGPAARTRIAVATLWASVAFLGNVGQLFPVAKDVDVCGVASTTIITARVFIWRIMFVGGFLSAAGTIAANVLGLWRELKKTLAAAACGEGCMNFPLKFVRI